MDISTLVNIILCILSFLLSVISVVSVVLTLRQNNKMIENSSRPYVQVYPVYTNGLAYIIIKNFGSSSAVIDKLLCSHKFTREETFGDDLGTDIFDNISGAFLSPNYSIRCPLMPVPVSHEKFAFEIQYHSSCKKYSEKFCFTLKTNSPFADTYPSGRNSEDYLKLISKELHDLVKMQL